MNKYCKYSGADKICGVYKITNIITNECYVGSSVNVVARFSNHMNRDARRYPTKPFYIDVNALGYKCFTFEILEICDKDRLLELEQYWYDKLKPTYNFIRPTECNFKNKDVMLKTLEKTKSEEHSLLMKNKYSSEHYKKLFKDIQRKRFVSVEMYNEHDIFIKFESMSECARWLDKNTSFKCRNKVSKIKDVCDGKRKTSYGFKFKYSI